MFEINKIFDSHFRAVYCSLDAVQLLTLSAVQLLALSAVQLLTLSLIVIYMLSTVGHNVDTLLKTYMLICMWWLPTHIVTAPTSLTFPVVFN